MKSNIEATVLNGKKINVEIDIYLDGIIRINAMDFKKNDLIPMSVYSDVQFKLVEFLSKYQTDIKKVDFNIVSKSLEELKRKYIKVDNATLSDLIYNLILKNININDLKDKNFFKVYESEDNLINDELIRVEQLYNEKKYLKSFELLSSLDYAKLNIKEKKRADFLKFQLILRNSTKKQDDLFYEYIKKVSDDPLQIKLYYFEYIKFCENIRDINAPRKLIDEFMKKFPKSILDKNELSIYYYLKGRAEYLRGEFIAALEYFSKSLKNTDKKDKKFLSAIYNSSANSFTDNLFFDEAEELANKALEIRELLDLPEKYETISCLAGIAFKKSDFEKSHKLYLESEKLSRYYTLTSKDQNRLYNYIAKSAIMLNKIQIAKKYLKKAEKSDDTKGFTKYLNLLLLLKQKKYKELKDLFKKSMLLPKNHEKYDNFALGWGYAFIAQGCFEQKAYKDGVIYLSDSINFFLEDLYVLEAFYVSNYIYIYMVPSNSIDYFRQLTSDYQIIQKFEEYVNKHSVLNKKYAKIFKIKQSKSLLKEFYEKLNEVNDDNYNPESVKYLLDLYCLI